MSKENVPEDKLNRKPFAKHLVEQLLTFESHESQVVGILGDWGVGKTTFLDYLELESKEAEEAQRPVIVRFNPWWFSGREDLFIRFFGEMALTLGSGQQKDGLKFVASTLSKFAKGLSATSSALSVFGVAVPLASEISSAATKAASLIEPQKQSLDSLREDLITELIEAETRIWVFIDDIDRLEAEEMRSIFALVRSLGELPYITYVLALSPENVAQTLGKDGRAYLDKILPLTFTLPAVRFNDLQQLFIDEIGDVVEIGKLEMSEQQSVYQAFGYLQAFLPTLRHIKRLVDSVKLSYVFVKGEVYVSDFILLEALKLYEPEVYSDLSTYRDSLTGNEPLGRPSLLLEEKQYWERSEEKRREAFEKLKGKVRSERIEKVAQILQILFPKISRANFDYNRGAYVQRRICVPRAFFSYFELVPEQGLVSRQLIRNLKSIITSASGNTEEVVEGVVGNLAEKLDEIFDQASLGPISYLNVIDELITSHVYSGEFRNTEHDDWLLRAVLKNYDKAITHRLSFNQHVDFRLSKLESLFQIIVGEQDTHWQMQRFNILKTSQSPMTAAYLSWNALIKINASFLATNELREKADQTFVDLAKQITEQLDTARKRLDKGKFWIAIYFISLIGKREEGEDIITMLKTLSKSEISHFTVFIYPYKDEPFNRERLVIRAMGLEGIRFLMRNIDPSGLAETVKILASWEQSLSGV